MLELDRIMWSFSILSLTPHSTTMGRYLGRDGIYESHFHILSIRTNTFFLGFHDGVRTSKRGPRSGTCGTSRGCLWNQGSPRGM